MQVLYTIQCKKNERTSCRCRKKYVLQETIFNVYISSGEKLTSIQAKFNHIDFGISFDVGCFQIHLYNIIKLIKFYSCRKCCLLLLHV